MVVFRRESGSDGALNRHCNLWRQGCEERRSSVACADAALAGVPVPYYAVQVSQTTETEEVMDNKEEIDVECAMVGAGMLAAQRVEFLLYGLVAHIKPELKQDDPRFRRLTPESFLRGDLAELRATLGQLAKAHGEKFLLSPDDLTAFVKKRNLLAHDYWRLARANVSGAQRMEDPMAFLQGFLADCQRWEKILRGVLGEFRLKAARDAGDEEKAKVTADDLSCMDEYREHVRAYLSGTSPTEC